MQMIMIIKGTDRKQFALLTVACLGTAHLSLQYMFSFVSSVCAELVEGGQHGERGKYTLWVLDTVYENMSGKSSEFSWLEMTPALSNIKPLIP